VCNRRSEKGPQAEVVIGNELEQTSPSAGGHFVGSFRIPSTRPATQ